MVNDVISYVSLFAQKGAEISVGSRNYRKGRTGKEVGVGRKEKRGERKEV